MSRILLIEDDAPVRESLTEVLKSEGYDVVPRGDGSDLKQLLNQQKFELVITDLKLPGKNGMDLIREMRKSPSDYEIIIITGYGTMQSAIDALQLGVYDYINKPFEPTLMLNTVRRAVEKVKLSREKTEAEKTVRFLKDFNEEILESSPEAIAVLDRNIVCQYWNTAAEKLSGIKRDDIIGKDLVREKTWILGQAFPKQFQEVLNGNISEKLVDVFSPQKQPVVLKQKLSPLRDPKGRVKGILVFLADSTHQKTAESKSEDIKRRSKADQRKDVCLFNISRSAVESASIKSFFADALKNIVNSIESKTAVRADLQFDSKNYSYGKTSQNKSGFEIEFDAGIFGKGRLIIFSGESIKSEDKELITIAAKHIGNEIIRRYESVNSEHQKYMEAIGRLAGGLAHNMNNILSGILGYASFMKSGLPDDSPVQAYLSTIEQSSNLAVQMTNQLLDMNGGTVASSDILNVNDNISRITALLRIILDKNILINSSLTDDIYQIKGDSSKIDNVLLCICLNSWDAMPSGGKLSIQTENCDLQKSNMLLNLEEGKYVLITVTDTGAGLDENSLKHCFDPFYSTKGIGSGLSLASAYGIIKAHGGRIFLESESGKGTAVKIYLPATEKRSRTENVSISAETPNRVLVIDADESAKQATTEMLKKLGYIVTSASTIRDAVSILKKEADNIEIIFLDVDLPDSDYSNIYKDISNICGEANIILSSAYKLSDKVRQKSKKEGVLFVQKPYSFKEVADIVHQASASQSRGKKSK